MQEIWKDVVGYEGIYQVSSLGNLKSCDMYVLARNGKRRKVKGKILKKRYMPNGYVQYVLCKDGVKKYFYAHRLVATAFISNENNLPQVNHKNEDKKDNNVDNLEWCDQIYNNLYGTKIERSVKNTDYKSVALKNSKKVSQYDLNNNFIATWCSISEAARVLHLHSGDISYCCRNKKIKSAGGYIWRYAD